MLQVDMMATSGMATAALRQLPQLLPLQVLLSLLLGISHKPLHLPQLLTHTPTKHLHTICAILSADISSVKIQTLMQMLMISYTSAGRCCQCCLAAESLAFASTA